ncbi:thioesterase II family protein [Azohydromonas lata]|uniref:thioesterase II family protein n=1 Tax=Azohydromonas lata TaxID=45677 RepID=UPI000835E50E|nr:alpha/beta fold hydrolase [Azohydromonas lata]
MRPPFLDLLMLPCAGASATMYLRWRRLLPQWVRLVPVELPGRGGRMGEPHAENFSRLVDQLCDEQAQALQGRYVLFGHSMGGLLAYGIAQRQRALSRPLPQAMFVSASSAPSRRDPDRFVGKDNDAALIADLRKQGGTPEEVFNSNELLRLTLDTLGADYRVCESFAYGANAPLPLSLHVLAGRHDDIAAERMEAWRHETDGAFTLDWFDGGHFFIRQHEQQVLAVVVRELTRQLSGAGHAIAVAA